MLIFLTFRRSLSSLNHALLLTKPFHYFSPCRHSPVLVPFLARLRGGCSCCSSAVAPAVPPAVAPVVAPAVAPAVAPVVAPAVAPAVALHHAAALAAAPPVVALA